MLFVRGTTLKEQFLKEFVETENTHTRGKFHSTGGVQFDWIKFYQ